MGLLQCSADSYYSLEFFCPSTPPRWGYVWVTTTVSSATRTATATTLTATTVTRTTATSTSATRSSVTATSTSRTATWTTSTANESLARQEEGAASEAFYPIAGGGLLLAPGRGWKTRRAPK